MYEHAKAAQSLFTEIGAKAIVIRSFPKPVQPIKPERDGFLTEVEFEQGAELELLVTVPKKINAVGIVVHSFTKDKPIITKKDQADESKPYRMYRKTVRSRTTREELMSTKHDVNNIRLVVVENGIFQMWEIAIPTRIIGPTASFFLTIQRLYKATMYNLNGQIYMPEHEYDGYRDWIDLQKLLATMVSVETLPKIDQPLAAPATSPIVNGNHRVMFFCLASGLGLAQTSQGPAFIHWKELPRDDRFTCVRENQLIGGEVISTDKGRQLTNIRILG